MTFHQLLHSLWFQYATASLAAVAFWGLLTFPLLMRKLGKQHGQRMAQDARYFRALVTQHRRILVALGVDPDHDDTCPACGGTGSRWDSSGRGSNHNGAGRPASYRTAPGSKPRATDGEDTEVLAGRPYLTRGYGHVTTASDVDATRDYGGVWTRYFVRDQPEPLAPGSVRHSERPADDLGRTLGQVPWPDGSGRLGRGAAP